jgi:hypothetical protein
MFKIEEVKKVKDKSFHKIYFADFESFTKSEMKENIQHDPFLICYNHYDVKTNKLSPMSNGRNIFSLLNHIYKSLTTLEILENKKVARHLVYFHNLSYDTAFILKEFVKISSFLMVNGSVL